MDIQDFVIGIGDAQDTTLAVRQALREIREAQTQKANPIRLVFPPGRYHFWPDRAEEHYLFVSNNDEGLKSVAFPMFGLQNIEIDGQGSEFVFHGNIVPFAVQKCDMVRFQNFSIDWDRTFHNEAEVLSAVKDEQTGNTSVDLRFSPEFEFVVEHERLVFVYEGQKDSSVQFDNMLEFDPVRRETAFQVTDNYRVREGHRAVTLAPNVVRVTAKFSTVPTPGNIAVINASKRDCPGFAISNSSHITLSDVTITHCGGMGIIAQLTEEITLERVRITPNRNKGRMISITADATHFVNCRGQITITDCLFENQMDDATNVHGIYTRLSAILSPTEIEVELLHFQQFGMDIYQTGDTLEFVRNTDLVTYDLAEVAQVERLNKRFSRITLASQISPDVQLGHMIANRTRNPDVTIRSCVSRGNRARGFLISTAGKVLIEDNAFHSPGAAILIAGDANYWFESGAVRDVIIRDNHFDNCNYGVWGRACLEINPEIAKVHRGETRYHRNIRIERNTFEAFDMRLLCAHCVDGLMFQNNVIRQSDQYPVPLQQGLMVDITDSSHVHIAENDLGESHFDSVSKPFNDVSKELPVTV